MALGHGAKIGQECFASIWQYFNTNLYDKRGPALHDLRWDLVQLTVLDGHDFELGAESELEWQRLQRRVVVDVQRLERLEGADLLGQVGQHVLSHRKVLQLRQLPAHWRGNTHLDNSVTENFKIE